MKTDKELAHEIADEYRHAKGTISRRELRMRVRAKAPGMGAFFWASVLKILLSLLLGFGVALDDDDSEIDFPAGTT